ncbi:hypothetical protein [Rhizobium laguerreae]|uniref:hypothetical protein n=2 Tax=Rhizobium TaxID=379 RepID=UPI0010396E69|nr:hypothetical protein [Rhizobium laguerreae]MBY3183298.1 hypothetical protein [Rhizobium laguerreae]MBY3220035.1 hypothetical protein [Rhizobium laguerreae]MBY3378823.1 hypothetical protein [Rhizobium laguerreae]NKM69289.1 hypothetical protein [Rhizobium laguerreae]TBY08923.1 hypothetical protein E0J21_12235 [Rhizobium laguerreae]
MRSKAVLCVAIMMFTGFRVSDVSRLGPQHRRRDMFKRRLFKNCNLNPYDIEIAIHPILEAVLAMHMVTDLTYIATEFGKPFSIRVSETGSRIGSVRPASATSAPIPSARDWRPTLPTRRPTA